MQRFTGGHAARRARWRPFAWAITALMAVGLAAAFATAASAAPAPAAGVSPGAAAAGSFNYVFYTAGDGSVWQKAAGSNSRATSVGGVLVSAPSPITLNSSTIRVFGEGTDHALWTTRCSPGGGCGAWTSLGGGLTSKPGAVFAAPNRFGGNESVYVRGTDGALWVRDNSSTGGWAPWQFVGGRLLSGTGPCATTRNGSQYVLVTGTDKGLWLDQIGGSGFRSVGGRTTATPALANDSSGLVGYARGTDDTLWWENVSTGNGWKSLGGFLTSGCGGATNGVPFGYALGGNGQVWQNRDLSSTGWTQVTR